MQFTGTSQSSPLIRAKLWGKELSCLVDSGSGVSLVSADFLQKYPDVRIEACNMTINTFNEKNIILNRKVWLPIKIDKYEVRVEFFIAPKLLSSHFQVLLGNVFLSSCKVILDFGKSEMKFRDVIVPFENFEEKNAEFLSRGVNEILPEESAVLMNETQEPRNQVTITKDFQGHIKTQQKGDAMWQRILKKLTANQPVFPKYLKFFVQDDLLCCKNVKPRVNESRRIVVPSKLVPELLSTYHDLPTGEHRGSTRTLKKIKRKFYWNGMYTNVRNYVKSCTSCNQFKPHQKNKLSALQSLPDYNEAIINIKEAAKKMQARREGPRERIRDRRSCNSSIIQLANQGYAFTFKEKTPTPL